VLIDAKASFVLADFGLALDVKFGDRFDASVAVGSAFYLAPEVWKARQYSSKSDVLLS